MSLDDRYPALSDLRARARRRIPHFAWEYLESGTGDEAAMARSRAALDAVLFRPQILNGRAEVDLTTPFLGQDYGAPFGMSPVGMSGLFWPRTEQILADAARTENLPYSLSTVAAQSPEDLAPHIGGNGWFQLYPPDDRDQMVDLVARAKDAGFTALILTVDVPGPSRRERQRRGGVTTPPRLTPRLMTHAMARPAWSLQVLRHGMPSPRALAKYPAPPRRPGEVGNSAHAGPDWSDWARLRKIWDGPLIAKGVLVAEDAVRLKDEGADAIWVSNHGGRQFDGAPGAGVALPLVRDALGPDYPLLYDGAITSGLDVLRAIALGADFVMLGRAWHHAVAALGARGPAHMAHILRADMGANMAQMGISRPVEARDRLWR